MAETEASGIRAEIRVSSPSDCPVAGISDKNGATSRSVSRTSSADSSVVTEEAVFDNHIDMEDTKVGDDSITEMDEVFSYDSETVFRFSREKGRGCACECIEGSGFPVVDTYTHDGDLFLTFHVPDKETLKRVIERLGERYTSVEVRRLIRSETGEGGRNDLVLVDRSELTEKQKEALRKAHEMGYFEHPKDANAGEVAEELGVATSTFTEHLSVAQSKVLRCVVDG